MSDKALQRRQAIATLCEVEGVTVENIAEELGVSTALVYSDLKILGITLSRGRDDNGIASAYAAGDKLIVIATRYGVSVSTVYQILAENGMALRTQEPAAVQGRQMQIDAAVEMYATGIPLRVIEAEAGVSVNALYRELAKRGVPLRRVVWREQREDEAEAE